jgi:hypothetical protein
MKVKLVIAFAVLFLASVAHADEIQTDSGPVYIPDGSVVTLIQDVQGELPYTSIVDFSFADGTGYAITQGSDGGGGGIYFTTPVSDLSFDWDGFSIIVSDNLGDVFTDDPAHAIPDNPTQTFSGPGITYIGWADYFGPASGIGSMTYTEDVAEPNTLPLLGLGLIALLAFSCRKISDYIGKAEGPEVNTAAPPVPLKNDC